MIQHANKIDEKMARDLDRLVTGELAEPERRELLAWCAERPDRWRLCAMAFLEAQTWESVLSNWGSPKTHSSSAANAYQQATTATTHRTAWPTIAAVLLIGCLMGAVIRDIGFPNDRFIDRTQQTDDGPAIATAATDDQQNKKPQPEWTRDLDPTYLTVPIQTNLGPGIPAELRIAVTAQASSKQDRAPKQDVPEYVRKQWEKRGYQVAQTERFLNAKLPDGEKVVVPVSGLEVKYVGRPVY
jgi:hypothetical protein